MDEINYKYKVIIRKTEKYQKITDNIRIKLKKEGLVNESGKVKLPGVSSRILKMMKKEFVDCPVLEDNIQFIQCFICPNFQSRVTGTVLCKGNQLQK